MPDWKTLVQQRLRQLSRDGEADADVADELTAHLQDRYDELRSAGFDEADAVDTTLRELFEDDPDETARWTRRNRTRSIAPPAPTPGAPPLAGLWRDLLYGLRLLGRAPGATALIVVTLALGIAANTTAFTVINSLLLNPLPVARASELVSVSTRETADAANANVRLPLSHPNLVDLAAQNTVFTSLAGHSGPMSVTLTGRALPERMFTELVTANYFETLGVKPRIGRFFLPEEDRVAGRDPVLVLTYAAWQRRFGARPDIVGQTIEINRTAFTVIGVAAEGFRGLDPVFGPDAWVPATMIEQIGSAERRSWLTDRAALGFGATGRLRPGRTLAQADANLTAIAADLARTYPAVNRGRTVTVQPLTRAELMGASPQLAMLGSLALMAIPGLVLLIACSNVANLLLARATARRHEIGVRLALGAGRLRVLRQLLTENALLGALGGLVGLAAALGGARLLSSLRPPEFAPNLVDVSVDVNVVAFAIVLSALTTMIFGVAPALATSRTNLVAVLGQDARVAGQPRRTARFRHLLLVGQVALSLMALATAGLFLRSVQRGYAIDPGFERQHLGILLFSPGQAGYDRAKAEPLYRTIRDRIGALPGVASVALASNMPLFSGATRKLAIDGRTDAMESGGALTVVNSVEPTYFTTIGVALLGGRAFTTADGEDGQKVAIVNDVLARQYWPGRDPIGQHLAFVGDTQPRRIVGVAETVNYDGIGEAPQPCVYLPLAQNFADSLVLHVRTNGDPSPVLSAVQREMRAIDDRLDVADVRTGQKLVEQALFGATMTGGILGVFGLIALGLASLGMYGVMACNVSLRGPEVAVRMAFGADQRAVLALVLRDGLQLVAIGLVVGAAGAGALSTALSSLLPGMGRIDWVSFAVAMAVLLTVAVIACYVPARRASRLDPLVVIRGE
jgi:macrolide transport system ATP-binding/permease protein